MFAMVSGAENKRYTAVSISDKIRFIETPSMAMPALKGRANFLNLVSCWHQYRIQLPLQNEATRVDLKPLAFRLRHVGNQQKSDEL